MPASAEPTAKLRSSIKNAKPSAKAAKSTPTKLTSTTTMCMNTSAQADEVNTASLSPSTSPSTPAKTILKKKKLTTVTRRSGTKTPPSSPLRPSKAREAATTPPRQRKDDDEYQLRGGKTTKRKQQTQKRSDAVDELAEKCHSLPPPCNTDSSSDDGLDVTSTSSVSNTLYDDGDPDGSVRRVPEHITSLAGRRHTKVVVRPPITASNGNSNNNNNGVFTSFAAPAGGNGMFNSRTTGVSGRRGGPSSGLNNSHHHVDNTLRYRTDLDKQVIHFMFERYHQEQICPTISSLLTSAAEEAEGGGAAGVETKIESNSNNSADTVNNYTHMSNSGVRAAGSTMPTTSTAAHPSPSSTLTPPPPLPSLLTTYPQSRGRRITVEEVYVPANNDGDDKHIGLGDWHFFWMHVGRVRHTICSSDFRWHDQQIINHFPDHAELTRKDLMYRNIKRYLRENQANNYARLTLHTATDWVSAAANAAVLTTALSSTGGGIGENSCSLPPISPFPDASNSTSGLSTKAFCFADSVPITYNIPNDLSTFKEECQKQRGTQWIVKPTSRSQGKGIFLINDVRALQRWLKDKKDNENMTSFLATGSANRASWVAPSVLQQQKAAQQSMLEETTKSSISNNNTSSAPGGPSSPIPAAAAANNSSGDPSSGVNNNSAGGLGAYIVSRYISNPLLIGGKKFDLRLYVLVTSYKPLVAYLHEDGFARFCATRYNGSSLAQADLGSHLTNVALQKGDEHYNTSHGGKWSFQNLFLYVQGRYGPYAAEGMSTNIQFLIYHSLKAVEPVMFNDKHCFELYGYDILIDDHINPHLIEVNASPSMSTTTVSDRLLKEQVLTDALKIIFPPGFPANSKAVPYWEYRQRTDLTTQQQTGFKLLQF